MLNLKASSYSKLPSLAAYCSSKVIKYFFNQFSLLLLNYILSISLLSFFIYIYIHTHTHTHTHTHIYISLFCLGQTPLLLPSLPSFFFFFLARLFKFLLQLKKSTVTNLTALFQLPHLCLPLMLGVFKNEWLK